MMLSAAGEGVVRVWGFLHGEWKRLLLCSLFSVRVHGWVSLFLSGFVAR